jgi:hypothetical protein
MTLTEVFYWVSVFSCLITYLWIYRYDPYPTWTQWFLTSVLIFIPIVNTLLTIYSLSLIVEGEWRQFKWHQRNRQKEKGTTK